MSNAYDSISATAQALRDGQVSSVELVEDMVLAAKHDSTNSVVRCLEESALQAAAQADAQRAKTPGLHPLHGIPFGVKENMDVAGVETVAGSRVLEGRIAPDDAAVVRLMRSCGAIPTLTLAMHEFAHGLTSESHWRGPVRNAWDRERYAGGSSGGSAAAVASGLCLVALGSDTGGSVRVPAALNGLVGLRPSVGAVSNDGVLPLAWTLDTCGPLARTAEDVSLVYEALSGGSHRHEFGLDLKKAQPLAGVRLGVVAGLDMEALEAGVLELFEAAQDDLMRLGAQIVEVSIPGIDVAHAALMLVDLAEPSVVHAGWINTNAAKYGQDIRTLIYAGQTISSLEYLQAQQTRQILARSFASALTQVDAILTPTVGFVAPRIGETSVTLRSGVSETMIAAALRYSAYASAAGLPAISVPCGFDQDGLPAGIQLIGKRHCEAGLLKVAKGYQAGTSWHRRRPGPVA
ncbi:MAG: amidase [Micrococcales bacterium]|nr:amidase [Micrococcales bacterium]